MNTASLEFLKGLGSRMDLDFGGRKGGMFHGSPRDDDEYVFKREANSELLRIADVEIVITGHTHRPYVKTLPEGILVNPGSVGQPRDGDSRASYLMYFVEDRAFRIRRVAYPARQAAEAIWAAGLPEYLGTRLLVEDSERF